MRACDLCQQREAAFFVFLRDLRRLDSRPESCFLCPTCLPRYYQEQALRARAREQPDHGPNGRTPTSAP